MTLHIHIEKYFEKVADLVTVILGNSITFIVALCMIVFWFSNRQFYVQDIHDSIGDVILGVTFLSLFIIQKNVQSVFGGFAPKNKRVGGV
jgi:hypothetical protein